MIKRPVYCIVCIYRNWCSIYIIGAVCNVVVCVQVRKIQADRDLLFQENEDQARECLSNSV